MGHATHVGYCHLSNEVCFCIFQSLMFNIQDRCLEWFPRLRAISLAVEDVDGEQNEWKTLQGQVSQKK